MGLLGSMLGWLYREDLTRQVAWVERDRALRAANSDAWRRASTHTAQPPRFARIERIERETPDTVSLYLHPDDVSPIHYRPGQFLTCCFDLDGTEQRRAYSLSAPPDQGHLRITIKQLKDGRVSPWVHDRLKVGDRLRVLGPSGEFVLAPDVHEAVFIAAGTGITPIRGLLEAMLRRDGQERVTLIYASRNPAHIIFRDELEALAQAYPNLRLHLVLSRPGKQWQGLRGRLDTDRLQTLITDAQPAAHCHFYMCGPDSFMNMARETLQVMEIPPARIHSERFLPAAQASRPHPTEPQEVHFLRSDRRVTVQPGQSLLEAGLAAGVALDYSCQVGGCGHCRVKVAQGEVISDEPNCLSPEEFSQGYRLACLSYPCNATQVDA